MGTVDVERYTGPCLISTAVRPKRSDHSDKNEADKSRRLSEESMAVKSSNLLISPPAVGGAGPQFTIPPNDPRNWAGVPLVSIAASIRKGSKNKNSNSSLNINNRSVTKEAAAAAARSVVGHVGLNWRPTVLTPPVYVRTSVVADTYSSVPARNHHSLQGAPLIRVPRPNKNGALNGRRSKNGMARSSIPMTAATLPTTHVPPPPLPSPLPPPPPPPPTSSSSTVPLMNESSESLDGSSSCLSSDSSSVTSDEGLASAGSESSLPRLIKPRKRRKKERKLAFAQRLESQPKSADGGDLLANEGDALAHLFHLSLSSPIPLTHLPSNYSPTDGRPISDRWSAHSGGRRDEEIWPGPGWAYSQDSLFPSLMASNHGASSNSWHNLAESKQHVPLEQQRSSCWPDKLSSPMNSVAVSEEGTHGPSQPEDTRFVSDSGCLEVSSQIITSPYGHRDIEIRFFSSFRHSSSNSEDKRSP